MSLELADNRLTLAGFAAVADAIDSGRLAALRRLDLYGNPVGWEDEKWHDWDGSICGGQLVVAPEVVAVLRRIPSRIAFLQHDPR